MEYLLRSASGDQCHCYTSRRGVVVVERCKRAERQHAILAKLIGHCACVIRDRKALAIRSSSGLNFCTFLTARRVSNGERI